MGLVVCLIARNQAEASGKKSMTTQAVDTNVMVIPKGPKTGDTLIAMRMLLRATLIKVHR